MKTPAPNLYRFLGFNTQGDIGPYTTYTAKDRGLVIFLRSPPRTPPTRGQAHQRNRFRLVGFCWRALTVEAREAWTQAGRLARLRITGFNLFTYFLIRHDTAAIRTVSRQTGIDLDTNLPLL